MLRIHTLPFHHEYLIMNSGYFVELICSTEVSFISEGLISWCKEFLNSAVYSVHFVLHIVCCPEWVLFLSSCFFLVFTVQSTSFLSLKYNVICFILQH